MENILKGCAIVDIKKIECENVKFKDGSTTLNGFNVTISYNDKYISLFIDSDSTMQNLADQIVHATRGLNKVINPGHPAK